MAEEFVSHFNCTLETIDSCPEELDWGKEWMTYIYEYDEEQAVSNFEDSWKYFGKGVQLEKETFYKQYLSKLAGMTQDIVPLVGTGELWTEELHDTWIRLFGSPNPLCYPAVPFDALTSQVTQGAYEMQVKVNEFDDPHAETCKSNAEMLASTIDDNGENPGNGDSAAVNIVSVTDIFIRLLLMYLAFPF